MSELKKYIKKIISEIEQKESKKEPFSKEEQQIMDLLVDANNIFVQLDKTHISEENDWNYAIHLLQRILGQRVLRRDYPDYFNSK